MYRVGRLGRGGLGERDSVSIRRPINGVSVGWPVDYNAVVEDDLQEKSDWVELGNCGISSFAIGNLATHGYVSIEGTLYLKKGDSHLLLAFFLGIHTTPIHNAEQHLDVT